MTETLGVGDIPTLIWRGAGPGQRPTIISLHGAGGNKRDIELETVDRLTTHGITIVTIDAYLHGDRAPRGFDIRTPETFNRLLFLEIIQRTAQDLFAVVARLQTDQAVESSRIGLRGGSMGGYIALAAVGLGLPVHAVVSVAGSADYTRTFVHLQQRQEPDASQVQQFNDLACAIDPIHHADRFSPRPVLQIHGACDPISPLAGDCALYQALVPYYQERPGDCLFLMHAGEHATPQALEERGWNWLARTVSPDCDAGAS